MASSKVSRGEHLQRLDVLQRRQDFRQNLSNLLDHRLESVDFSEPAMPLPLGAEYNAFAKGGTYPGML